MAAERRLELELVNVMGKPIGEQVDIMLRHLATGRQRVTKAKSSRKVSIAGLDDEGVYRVEIDPPSYLAAGAFVMLKASGATQLKLTFPVDPRKVKDAQFPSYDSLGPDAVRILEASKSVLSHAGQSGSALWDALDPLRRAGFLNIMTKMNATALTNGRLVASYVQEVTELRGDRFYAVVPKELREEVKNSEQAGLFAAAPDRLHHPPAGFELAGSYKTPDDYGNLQLTFFTNGTDWRADIDIDDADGLKHLFQVLEHRVKDSRTHPFDIRDILIAHQKLDPGYELIV